MMIENCKNVDHPGKEKESKRWRVVTKSLKFAEITLKMFLLNLQEKVRMQKGVTGWWLRKLKKKKFLKSQTVSRLVLISQRGVIQRKLRKKKRRKRKNW